MKQYEKTDPPTAFRAAKAFLKTLLLRRTKTTENRGKPLYISHT